VLLWGGGALIVKGRVFFPTQVHVDFVVHNLTQRGHDSASVGSEMPTFGRNVAMKLPLAHIPAARLLTFRNSQRPSGSPPVSIFYMISKHLNVSEI